MFVDLKILNNFNDNKQLMGFFFFREMFVL